MESRNKVIRLLFSFSGFAAIGCVVVALSTFLNWHIIPIFGVHMPVSGFGSSVPGKVVFGIFLMLALLFVLTYTSNSESLWRPLLLGVASIALIIFWIWHACYGLGGTQTTTTNGATSTESISVSLADGFYVTGGISIVLLFLSAIQLRISLNKDRAPEANN